MKAELDPGMDKDCLLKEHHLFCSWVEKMIRKLPPVAAKQMRFDFQIEAPYSAWLQQFQARTVEVVGPTGQLDVVSFCPPQVCYEFTDTYLEGVEATLMQFEDNLEHTGRP